ncbi:MAG TPA: hypothetical protein PLB96_02980 [Syntrophales bacterium]|nr:hypothetical protein [Syntrophales bacterium]
MRWLEVIRVRTLYASASVLSYLTAAGETLTAIPELKRVEIYAGMPANTDIAIHLLWEKGAPPPYGSEPGQRMVSDLRKFGLVDHTTWRRREVPDTTLGRDVKEAGMHIDKP